uniref:Uncharacterized protein n=1 Tax=Anguilla anguilla TaxID=7936 RepID=A0A0E9P6A6_ANGAN
MTTPHSAKLVKQYVQKFECTGRSLLQTFVTIVAARVFHYSYIIST